MFMNEMQGNIYPYLGIRYRSFLLTLVGMSLPPLKLHECEETSLTVQWKPFSRGGVKMQFKLAQVEWNNSKEFLVNTDDGTSIVFGLEPGTPYSLRLKCGGEYGPEVVYDTLPIGCTPKKKKRCIIM